MKYYLIGFSPMDRTLIGAEPNVPAPITIGLAVIVDLVKDITLKIDLTNFSCRKNCFDNGFVLVRPVSTRICHQINSYA